MSTLESTVKRLQTKVEKLVHLHQKLEQENIKLKQKFDELTKNAQQQSIKLKELEEKNKILKISKTLSETNENSSDAKSKINELVREIDRCIALLNE